MTRLTGYLSTLWGGIAYTRSLEKDLAVLSAALRATERARDQIAAERDKAWTEITELEIERDAAEATNRGGPRVPEGRGVVIKYPQLSEAQKEKFRQACIADPTLNPRVVCPLCGTKVATIEPGYWYVGQRWVHAYDELRCRRCCVTYSVLVPSDGGAS